MISGKKSLKDCPIVPLQRKEKGLALVEQTLVLVGDNLVAGVGFEPTTFGL